MKTQPPAADRKGCEILVVDDNPRVRQVLSMILSAQGHRITEAAGGTEALAQILDNDFEILITDLQMHPVDGYMLVDALKMLPNSRRKPAVIVCSALVGEKRVDSRPELRDAVRLLGKPIAPLALVAAVEAAFQAAAPASLQNLLNPTH